MKLLPFIVNIPIFMPEKKKKLSNQKLSRFCKVRAVVSARNSSYNCIEETLLLRTPHGSWFYYHISKEKVAFVSVLFTREKK